MMFTIKDISDFYQFQYPNDYLSSVQYDTDNYGMWYLLEEKEAYPLMKDLKKRYPLRKLIPFARRLDNDDTACFEENKGGKVEVIHDFAAPGWEQRQEYLSFTEWTKSTKDV